MRQPVPRPKARGARPPSGPHPANGSAGAPAGQGAAP